MNSSMKKNSIIEVAVKVKNKVRMGAFQGSR